MNFIKEFKEFEYDKNKHMNIIKENGFKNKCLNNAQKNTN